MTSMHIRRPSLRQPLRLQGSLAFIWLTPFHIVLSQCEAEETGSISFSNSHLRLRSRSLQIGEKQNTVVLPHSHFHPDPIIDTP
ncbi:hypothetical protein BKA93DRAFT_788963, partial [Sparassis latifolia]